MMIAWIALAALVAIALGSAALDIALWRAGRRRRRRVVVLHWLPRSGERARRAP